MDYELNKYYDLLGLRPGASAEELKVAYRDLTKVWHPDRFLHDPRLQAKAQEKLKQINEAYDHFRSRPARERQPPPTQAHYDRHAQAQTGSVAIVERTRWRLILTSVLIFAVVFLVTSGSHLRPGEKDYQSQVPAMELGQAQPNQVSRQSSSSEITAVDETRYVKDRIEIKSQREESRRPSEGQPKAALLLPLPTITVVIDPSTGMIARRACPMKATMTYPSGNEPHQYCTLHLDPPPAPAEANAPKDSRLKSAAKRLTSPDKWFD